MSTHGRSVNLDSPRYLEGARLANLLLDNGEGLKAADWINLGEAAKVLAHNREDTDWYHVACGFTNTLREFVEEQGT